MNALKFSNGNAKLPPSTFIFSLPAGHTCPFAKQCKSKTHRYKGTIKDGPHVEHRCYAASSEMRPAVRNARWYNFDLLRKARTKNAMKKLILDSLHPLAGFVRIHESGDFYNQEYFDAWLAVAKERPQTHFYAYTKALPFWKARIRQIGKGFFPDKIENFVLTASYGGTHDHLIEKLGLRYAKVIGKRKEAEELGLKLDHTDFLAMYPGPSFGLLLHGVQPAGSQAAKDMSALRKEGWYGYGKFSLQMAV